MVTGNARVVAVVASSRRRIMEISIKNRKRLASHSLIRYNDVNDGDRCKATEAGGTEAAMGPDADHHDVDVDVECVRDLR